MIDKKQIKSEQGITLIVLAVTVLVMLILSAVVIKVAVGDEGLIDRAQDASDRYQAAQDDEVAKLNKVDGQYNKVYDRLDGTDIEEIPLPNPSTTSEPIVSPLPTPTIPDKPLPSSSPTPTQPPSGIAALKGAAKVERTITVKDDKDRDVTIPGKFRVAEDSATDANKGIVIVDENGNEYVWVPVPNPSNMYTEETVNLGGVEVTTNRYSKLRVRSDNASSYIPSKPSIDTSYHVKEPDLLTHTTYGDFNSNDTARGVTQIKNVLGIEGGYDEEILNNFAGALKNEYQAMLDSIIKYNGFYIGRYELSGTVASPICQRGGTVLTNQNWYNLKKACTDITSNEYAQSMMIYGCQWDETMDWIVRSGAKSNAEVNASSSTWGNYTGAKKSTAYNEEWKANNIYDLAGNCREWTQEAYQNSKRVFRGGYYSSSSSPASNRSTAYPYSDYAYISSRPTLYIK